jgi:putative nucleotidyltransferase with HDIG domain
MMGKQISELFNKLDSSTYNHSIRVMDIAIEVEKYLNLSDKNLSHAALLHDIGKIYVPMKILDKVGKLSPLERELLNLHSYAGYMILKDYGFAEDICRIVLYHHGLNPVMIRPIDRYNNNSVLEQSFMLHSIDEFEALTSDRPYHRGVPAYKALEIMLKEENHHPKVLEYISKVLEKELPANSALHRCHNISGTNLNIQIMDLMSTEKIAL